MITGSFASALHGEPRATRDIDVVIDPENGAIELLVAAFPRERFYVGDAAQAVRRRDMFNIIDTSSGWKVDLIVRKDRPFSRAEFERRVPANLAGIETYVTTPEDAILSKIEWQAVSRSEVQRRDVVEMLITNRGRLDRSYLQHWASELGVADDLSEMWDEAASQY